MSRRWQNAFFLAGVAFLLAMASQLDFQATWAGLQRAGYWAVAVVALWAFLYVFNTAAWWLIIRSALPHGAKPPAFGWLYRVTVSGFALNYATPGGLMGGEPYKIMMLRERMGTERATSSVILHTMTHIFSHFWFWLLAVVLYVLTEPLTAAMGCLLAVTTAFCLTGIWFFLRGYRRGMAVWVMRLLSHFPLVRRWAEPFVARNADRLAEVDAQIAALHGQNRRVFVVAVGLELACRIVSALEILFVLLVICPSAGYLQSLFTLAFTSLFANLLFFIPLQLGGREGGFLMSASGLGLPATAGIFVALIVRVRELVWTCIGLLLIKMDKKTGAER